MAHGVGGAATSYSETAVLTFADDTNLYVYETRISIAGPSEHARLLPSLLGRDVIDRWLMVYHRPADALEIEVVSADLVEPIDGADYVPIAPDDARQ